MSRLSATLKNSLYLLAIWLLPHLTKADNFGLDDTARQAGLAKVGDLATRSGQIIGALLSLVGVVFLILMIYGGITWMTAGGNEKQVKTAKDTITAAIGGLVVVLSAYAITAFLGSSLGK